MREIKFRVWSNKSKSFKVPFETKIIHNYPDYYLGIEPGEEEILMQYTGLKDKNGKEIYEGDIILGKDPNNIYTTKLRAVIFYINDDDIGFLPFNETIDYDGITWKFRFGRDIEVIGNIYENGDLLK